MICNLTKKIIKHPVIAKDGYIYEHIEILLYLFKYNKSPISNEYMDIYDLKIYKNN